MNEMLDMMWIQSYTAALTGVCANGIHTSSLSAAEIAETCADLAYASVEAYNQKKAKLLKTNER